MGPFLLSVSEIGRQHCAVRDPAAVIRSNGLREQKTLSFDNQSKNIFSILDQHLLSSINASD